MITSVELIYDQSCPNVDKAREVLREAFAQAGFPPAWIEWDRESPESPVHARRYGSPTILVNGKDIAGGAPNDGANCCRLYVDGDKGFSGVPSVDDITTALKMEGAGASGHFRKMRTLGTIPGIGAALLPVGVCPACWPAYAGVMGSLGLGFLINSVYLFPLTAIFLAFGLGALLYRAKKRRGYGPFALGTAGTIALLAGKFALSWNLLFYTGLVLFIAASMWNAWPRKKDTAGSCEMCVVQE